MRLRHQPRSAGPLLLLAAAALFLFGSAPLGSEPARPAAPEKPRLVVVVVIDQLRADYFERFRDRFVPDGFNRLRREGANFVACFYPYANTETAPGHATISTGTTPNRHGISGNAWYDFERGRMVQAVEDDAYPPVGGGSRLPGLSPLKLIGSTLGDELRLATGGQAKVWAVGIKDRAAILLGGHAPTGAYWYDYDSGRFATSRYYREALPEWIEAFNARRPADRYYGKDWKKGERVFLSMSAESGKPDAAFYRRLPYTPYGNELVLELAREAVEREGLGGDETTDILFVALCANDFVGHRWGPYSDEVAEMTLATDAQLAELFQFLDARLGKENYWVALSADHGVSPTLAQARARGLPAKNVPLAALTEALNAAFAARWGEDEWLAARGEVVFNRETLRKHGVGVAEAAHLAGGALLGVDGVLGYVAGEETRLDPELTKAVRLSRFRGRTPDVYVVLEPFALVEGDRGGATHGSPFNYDTHVPLLLWGSAFRAGTYRERATPADLATTLAAALGLTPPSLADGQVLLQALQQPEARPRRAKPGAGKTP